MRRAAAQHAWLQLDSTCRQPCAPPQCCAHCAGCKAPYLKEVRGCRHTQGRALVPAVEACGLASTGLDGDVPVPVFQLAAFPEVQATVAAAFAAFQLVQVQFLEGRIPLGNASRLQPQRQ